MSKSNKSRRPRSRSRNQSNAPLFGIIAAVGVIAVVIGLVISVSRQTQTIEGVQTFSNLVREHVASHTYTEVPPVGGPHNSAWQNCGIYDTPVQSIHAVHSLEHGAVWISYRPDIGAEAIEQLRSIARGRSYILLAPYPDLPQPIGLSAWGANLLLESPSDERINQFINKYRNGPQTPEPGAVCTNGIGRPIE